MIAQSDCRRDQTSPRYTRDHFCHSSLVVFYETTRACDLICQHCRACAQANLHPNELTSAEARLLLDQLTDYPKPPMLVLTGGDPLKRPDIFDLVQYVANRGLEVASCLRRRRW